MRTFALIMAAGTGSRMGLGINKALLPLGGVPMVQRSAEAFYGLVEGIYIVTRKEEVAAIEALHMQAMVVSGGDTRQQSVLCGLRALPEDAEFVLVHDAARPFVTRDVIQRCIDCAYTHESGVASMPVADTIKQVGSDGVVICTPPRENLRAAQTPQAFRVAMLRNAIETLEARGETATDDAAAMEAVGHTVMLVEGHAENHKVTTPVDIAFAAHYFTRKENTMLRVGIGYDVHRLVRERPLILCGVTIPNAKGLLGHSDADVALHALADALLGSAAMGDIGRHFPDSDPAYEGVASSTLIKRVVDLLEKGGFTTQQVDLTIVAQAPKLSPYVDDMVRHVSDLLCIAKTHVNIKATTTEGLGFEGEALGISAHAVATVLQRI